jgi:hypothetical protein
MTGGPTATVSGPAVLAALSIDDPELSLQNLSALSIEQLFDIGNTLSRLLERTHAAVFVATKIQQVRTLEDVTSTSAEEFSTPNDTGSHPTSTPQDVSVPTISLKDVELDLGASAEATTSTGDAADQANDATAISQPPKLGLGPQLTLNVGAVSHSPTSTPDMNNGATDKPMPIVSMKKLDLGSTVGRSVDECTEEKRSKLEHFTPICSQVREDLYVGGEVVARNWETLSSHGITHVVNCTSATV